MATGVLALLLVGACFIALGLFVSTLTRNQIVAGTLTFGLLLGLWILGWMDDPERGTGGQGRRLPRPAHPPRRAS